MSRTKENKSANEFWHGGFFVSTSPIDDMPRLGFQHLSTAKRVARERTEAGFPCIFRQANADEIWEVVRVDDV